MKHSLTGPVTDPYGGIGEMYTQACQGEYKNFSYRYANKPKLLRFTIDPNLTSPPLHPYFCLIVKEVS